MVEFKPVKKEVTLGAAIAQLIRLRLPTCGPRFNPQAQLLHFFNLYLNCDEKRTQLNKERPGLAYFFLKKNKEAYKVSEYSLANVF